MNLLSRAYREVDATASRGDHAEAPARLALLIGVFVSAALLAVGLILVLVRREVRPDMPPPFLELLRGLRHAQGSTLLYLGLLALAGTPILRVVVMVGVYFRRGERFMLVVSLIVLFLLGLSVALGIG